MFCQKCGSLSKVLDTRRYQTYVRRRHECLSKCAHRFTTMETIVEGTKKWERDTSRAAATAMGRMSKIKRLVDSIYAEKDK